MSRETCLKKLKILSANFNYFFLLNPNRVVYGWPGLPVQRSKSGMKILFGNHTNKVTFKLFIFLKNISLCKFDQNDQPKMSAL